MAAPMARKLVASKADVMVLLTVESRDRCLVDPMVV